MEAMKDLGERIKAERIAQGYSIKTAAEASGIARDTWRKIEAGGSVHDTKRHVAMKLLGISEESAEWGVVGNLEDHAADMTGVVDLNMMFSQAVRFAATVGILVPEVREEAERVSIALSELFRHGLQLWDRVLPDDRGVDDDPAFHLQIEGGDGDADDESEGSAPTSPFELEDKDPPFLVAADHDLQDPLEEAEETERDT